MKSFVWMSRGGEGPTRLVGLDGLAPEACRLLLTVGHVVFDNEYRAYQRMYGLGARSLNSRLGEVEGIWRTAAAASGTGR